MPACAVSTTTPSPTTGHCSPALVAFAGADRVLLGSDRPFDMGSDHPVAEIRALNQPDAEDLILGGNAARLLGIAAARQGEHAP